MDDYTYHQVSFVKFNTQNDNIHGQRHSLSTAEELILKQSNFYKVNCAAAKRW